MKKKKLTPLDILDGVVDIDAALSRSEMKHIMAGSGSGCGPSCTGCIGDNSGVGPCVKWKCLSGGWCVPEGSDCCIFV